MKTTLLVLGAVLPAALVLMSGCAPTASSPATTPSPAVAGRLTIREAFDMAYERASAEYDDLYLLTMGAGAQIISFEKGKPPVGEGRSQNWLVSFARQRTEKTYSLVIVNIRGGVITNFYEGEGTLEVREASWEDFARKHLVDISRWNIDSPQAVEIAKKSDGEGLAVMFFAFEYYLLTLGGQPIAESPIYKIGLGPTTGEAGPGLNVWIDPADGTVLRTSETTWR